MTIKNFEQLMQARQEADDALMEIRLGVWKKLRVAVDIYHEVRTLDTDRDVHDNIELKWIERLGEVGFLSKSEYHIDTWFLKNEQGHLAFPISDVFFSEDEDRIKREFEKRFLDTRIQRVERDLVKARRIVVDNKTEIDRLERCLSREKRLLQQSENTVSSLQRELDQLREQHEAM